MQLTNPPANPARVLNAAPTVVQQLQPSQPDPTLSRTPELRIDRSFERTHIEKNVRHENTRPGIYLTGPRGIGKTVLIAQVAETMTAEGYRVLRLDHNDVRSEAALNDRIRRMPPYDQILRDIQDGQDAEAAHARAGNPPWIPQAWLAGRDADTHDVMELVSDSHPIKTVIIVDEPAKHCRPIERKFRHDSTPADYLVRDLGHADSGGRHRMDRCTLIVVGTPDVNPRSREILGAYRMVHCKLDTLPAERMPALLHRHLRTARNDSDTRVTDSTIDEACHRWTRPLMDRYACWTFHAAAAATAAVQVLRAAGPAAVAADWGLAHIMRLADAAIAGLHQRIQQDAETVWSRSSVCAIGHYAATLAKRDRTLSEDAFRAISIAVLAGQPAVTPDTWDHIRQQIKHLERVGLINDHHDRSERGHHTIPVPGMLEHLARQPLAAEHTRVLAETIERVCAEP